MLVETLARVLVLAAAAVAAVVVIEMLAVELTLVAMIVLVIVVPVTAVLVIVATEKVVVSSIRTLRMGIESFSLNAKCLISSIAFGNGGYTITIC